MPLIGRQIRAGIRQSLRFQMESGDFPVPVLFYKFGKNTGAVAKDSSPEDNDGTIEGATWAKGILGSGLSFDGIDNRVELASKVSTPDAFTILAWWKRLGNSGGISSDASHCLFRYINGEGNSYFRISKDGTTVAVQMYADSTAYTKTALLSSVTGFHFVGCMWDGTYLYAMADSVLSAGLALGAIDTDVNAGIIGWFSANYNIANGVIDEVHIYDVALSARQILELYYGIK